MPTVAKTNASGTARPTRPTVPCGLMFAAIDGAISAIEMPTASQSERLPRRRLRASPFEPSVTCAMGLLPDRGSPADYRTTNDRQVQASRLALAMGYSAVHIDDIEPGGPGSAVRFVRRALG